MERGAYTANGAASVMREVVDAVAYLHSMGIAHLDLKLDNCVRGRDDQWKWVDLGAASQGRMQRKVTGTGFYMAPELGRTGHEMDPAYDGFAVDCFALGVSLYLLLAGTFPFMPHDDQGTLAQPADPRIRCAREAQRHGRSTCRELHRQLGKEFGWPPHLQHAVDGLLWLQTDRIGLSQAREILLHDRGTTEHTVDNPHHPFSQGKLDVKHFELCKHEGLHKCPNNGKNHRPLVGASLGVIDTHFVKGMDQQVSHHDIAKQNVGHVGGFQHGATVFRSHGCRCVRCQNAIIDGTESEKGKEPE